MEGKTYREMVEAESAQVRAEFEGADEHRLTALASLIEQAACERLFLRKLNEQALVSGLVKIHPSDPTKQKALPISAEIARHSAALTNITDKLMKHLAPGGDEDDDGMEEYE